jgi:hypothetical protein
MRRRRKTKRNCGVLLEPLSWWSWYVLAPPNYCPCTCCERSHQSTIALSQVTSKSCSGGVFGRAYGKCIRPHDVELLTHLAHSAAGEWGFYITMTSANAIASAQFEATLTHDHRPGTMAVDIRDVALAQASVKNRFKSGRPLSATVVAMNSGRVDADVLACEQALATPDCEHFPVSELLRDAVMLLPSTFSATRRARHRRVPKLEI